MKTPQDIKKSFQKTFERLCIEVNLRNYSKQKDNETGDIKKELISEETIKAVFNSPTDNYELKRQGITNPADAKCFLMGDIEIKRDDEIEWNEQVFRVDRVDLHQWAGLSIYQSVTLYLVKQ